MSNKQKSNLSRFAPILHAPWEKGAAIDEIVHTWAEDSSKVSLHVPSELVDDLLAMQNWLHQKYKEYHRLLNDSKKIQSFFDP